MRNRALIIVCIMLFLNCSRDHGINHQSEQGHAPDFYLEDTNHQRFYLNQQRGKRVVIVFWVSWCKVCKQYLNALEKINAELKEKDITLVSIVIDPENTDTLHELLSTSIYVSYPILLDRKRTVMEKFNVKEMPTTLITGPHNEIVITKKGYNLSTLTQIQTTLNLLSEDEK
ncbi:MAG: peroxiredoxin family protein [bacterium]